MPEKASERHLETDGAEPSATMAGGDIDRHLAAHVEREVARQLKSLNLTGKDWGEVRELQQGLKLHHKIAYGTLVFLGVLLMWYGAWNAIAAIPVLKNPVVALVSGMASFGFTGVLYNKLTT